VEAYAAWLSQSTGHRCRIPTATEFLRAARGDGTDPYALGQGVWDALLVCRREGDDPPRPVSLLGRARLLPEAPGTGAPEPRLVGLAGNVAEYVRDERGDRLLLAGGSYRFPAETCTLDTFFDAAWNHVEYNWFEADRDGDVQEVSDTIFPYFPVEALEEDAPAAVLQMWPTAGFRVVREVLLP
jgi:hypothetical protein